MVLARDCGLVLKDCQMPEVDGNAATRAIRGQQLTHQPAIITFTAHALEGDREKCLAAGMDDYLSMRVLPDDLMRVVKQWLKNARPLPKPTSAAAATLDPSLASELPPIDPAAIARLGDTGDDEFVRRMIAVFLPDLDERLKSIRDAYAAVDASGVRQAAHALKGRCSHFGAKGLSGICADIERAAPGSSAI
jgi:two-component system, sensor histidine kinase and response regulator